MKLMIESWREIQLSFCCRQSLVVEGFSCTLWLYDMRKSFKERSREIGRYLARRRNASNLNQQDVGSVIGVTSQQISKYERGESDITVVRFEAIMAVIGPKSHQAGFREESAPYAAPSALQAECQQIAELLGGMAVQIGQVEARIKRLLAGI